MGTECDVNRKRVRDDDSGGEPHESKRVRVDSGESTVVPSDSRLSRVDSGGDSSEPPLDSAEAQLLQDDLLNILDESESASERDPAIQGLDSVIRSFEEEINLPEMVVTSDSGESQPQLGYLLEASDDELGLPPTVAAGGEAKFGAADFESGGSDGVVLDGNHGAFLFEEEIPSYDSFEFGLGGESSCVSGDMGSDYVALGGLFDGWDGSYENDVVSWRTESLPAL